MFGNNPLNNFLSLIDLENYEQDDNLKCSKQSEKVVLIKKLIEGLGFVPLLIHRPMWSMRPS